MAATIKIKNSSTTGSVPSASNLVQGELAVNVTDLGLYTENASGTVVKLNAPSIDDKNTGATKHLTIDTSGNLGIGTTSPGGRLDVQNNQNSTSNFYFRNTDTTNTNSRAALNVVSGTQSLSFLAINGDNTFIQRASGSLQFQLSGSTQALIDSSGNLLVGTTSVFGAGGISIQPSAGAPTVDVKGSATTNGSSVFNVYSTGASAYRFYVGMGGTISATSTTITGISDRRLKENIRDLDDGLEKVMALQPRKFDWKEGKGADVKNARGFIAQEFEQVFPDLIEQWKDEPPEGEEPYKAVRADLIPTLVKAIQEQQAIITDLTNRITALEGAK